MEDVAKQGRTVLFVSHNMAAVEGLCQKVVWLQHGRIHQIGDSHEIVPLYLRTALETITEQCCDDPNTAPGNDKVRLHRVCVRPADKDALGSINIRTPYVIEFEYWNYVPGAVLNISIVLNTAEQVCVLNTFSESASRAAGCAHRFTAGCAERLAGGGLETENRAHVHNPADGGG